MRLRWEAFGPWEVRTSRFMRGHLLFILLLLEYHRTEIFNPACSLWSVQHRSEFAFLWIFHPWRCIFSAQSLSAARSRCWKHSSLLSAASQSSSSSSFYTASSFISFNTNRSSASLEHLTELLAIKMPPQSLPNSKYLSHHCHHHQHHHCHHHCHHHQHHYQHHQQHHLLIKLVWCCRGGVASEPALQLRRSDSDHRDTYQCHTMYHAIHIQPS